jgi:small subunit ribosomal protein S9
MEQTASNYGTGRRKTAVARVYLKSGSGAILVNRRKFEEYFPNPVHRMTIEIPLVTTATKEKFDISVTVKGGGKSGQAGAVRHGIARALLTFDPELRVKLRAGGLLTRDAREVERKKPGRPKARKRFQFSKR